MYALDPDVERMLQVRAVLPSLPFLLLALLSAADSGQRIHRERRERGLHVCQTQEQQHAGDKRPAIAHATPPPPATTRPITFLTRSPLSNSPKFRFTHSRLRERTWGISVPGFDEASLRQQAQQQQQMQQQHMMLMARQQHHPNASASTAAAYLGSSSSRHPSASLGGQSAPMYVITLAIFLLLSISPLV